MTREEALNKLHNACVNHHDYLDALNMAIKALEQEPRKGHWIDTNNLDVKYKAIYMCSNCRSCYTEMKPINMNFCPNCGAQMDLEGNNETIS